MGSSPKIPAAKNASTTDDSLAVELSDGRSISVPLAWYPRLFHGTSEERADWRVIGQGTASTSPRSMRT